jgi:tetratricopeptide (TPR) repeat protein
MSADWRGLPVTGADDATRAAMDDFALGLLGYEPRIARILAAAEAAPGCALAQAQAAMLHMLAEDAGAPARARPFLRRAQAAQSGASEREQSIVAATEVWVEGDVARAIATGAEHVAAWPRDLPMAKIAQYHLFNLGDAPGMLRIGHRAVAANPDVAYAHGMLAFAQEQCHWLRDAEETAHDALRLYAEEPWAQHALAHVMLTTGRNAEARAFLEEAAPHWESLTSFMHTHNWWHLALVQIEQGDAARVLDYYDRHIWGVCKEFVQDQIGAVSLLVRLELAGVDVGDRWDDLAPYLAARIEDHVQPFLSMQYLLGLARAGRGDRAAEAAAMLVAIRATAASAPPPSAMAWQGVCVPACEALLAWTAGDWQGCIDRLGPVLPRMAEIGGSHAQRDLFEQVLNDSLWRSGQLVALQQRLELRRSGNPHSRPTLRRLSEIYRRLDLPEEAARMQAA